MEKISAFIITKNEEMRIKDAIESLQGLVDEILVVDSGSTDKTLEIAQALGVKTMFHEWEGYGQQKSFAEGQCKNDWILNIDADEQVTKELAVEIKEIFSGEEFKKYHGFKIKFSEIPHFSETCKNFSRKKFYLRLYNKNFCAYRVHIAHDSVVPQDESKIGILSGQINHRSIINYDHKVKKLNSYSNYLAKTAFEKGKKASILQILFVPPFAFFKHYILRRYFLYGVDGFIASYIYAFSRLLKYAKIREIYRKNSKKNHE